VAKAAWLEISLVVNGEMAEAVAEVLSRHVQDGIAIENIEIPEHFEENKAITGPLRVSGYLPMNDQVEENRRRIEEALWHLGQIHPLPNPEFKPIQETNWMEAWKKNYRPIPVGKKLIILPIWIDNPEPTRIPIKIDPGMAFGTGVHPTTQLSLRLLEDYVRSGTTVMDIGCGSGILSIAAHKLGAGVVYSVDVDGQAVEIARENADKNGIEEGGVVFETGSIGEIRSGLFPLQQAPVVVANILTHILIKLLDQSLADLIAQDGILLLSGILEEHEPEMQAAVEKHGLTIIKRTQLDDWVAFSIKNS